MLENQTCYQVDYFGLKRVEDWQFGPTCKQRRKRMLGHRRWPDLGPSCQATADEHAAAFQMFSSPIGLDDLSAESFVGIRGSRRNRRPYAGLRVFFLPANALSKLRR